MTAHSYLNAEIWFDKKEVTKFFLTISDPCKIWHPLYINLRTTFEVRLKYYPRRIWKRTKDPKDEVTELRKWSKRLPIENSTLKSVFSKSAIHDIVDDLKTFSPLIDQIVNLFCHNLIV